MSVVFSNVLIVINARIDHKFSGRKINGCKFVHALIGHHVMLASMDVVIYSETSNFTGNIQLNVKIATDKAKTKMIKSKFII